MDRLSDVVSSFLGLGAEPWKLTFVQIGARAIIVFIAAVMMVRLGDKRCLSNKTAFDAILGFILASMLARAVNGSSSFFPTIGGGFVLIGLHRLLAHLARDSHSFGNIIKGTSDQIVKDGRIILETMKSNDLSEHDLHEDMRLNANIDDISKVRAAYVERNGHISVVK